MKGGLLLQGFARVGDPASGVLGGDAVLGDEDRDIADSIVGVTHGDAEGVRVVGPAHEGIVGCRNSRTQKTPPKTS